MSQQEKPRDFRGINIFNKLLGKVRPTDAEGVDVTEQAKHSMRASIVAWQDGTIGDVRLVDKTGKQIENLPVVLLTPAGSDITDSGLAALKTTAQFSGKVYENQDTATVDTARRFETTSKLCQDVIIKVSTYAQLFGDVSNQRMRIEVGGNWSVSLMDLSTLYFKNATAGQNGVVNIIAVLK